MLTTAHTSRERALGSVEMSQLEKEITGTPGLSPKRSLNICAKIMFGGEEMSVGIPPMEVENAMPRKMDFAKPFTFFSPKRLFSDSTNALQFATIISAAAVLLTKMESTAPVHMMPSSMERGRVKRRMMQSAMRMCRFHFSIARDIKKPAKNKKITANHAQRGELPSLKYCVETVEAGRMLRNGKRITGSNAVTDSGMISLIHKVAGC